MRERAIRSARASWRCIVGNKLKNKVIVITGASSGIGEATARSLAAEGASLVLVARRIERLLQLEKELSQSGGRAKAIQGDVTSPDDLKKVVSQTVATFGKIDIWINNAGIMPKAPMSDVRLDEWNQMIDVNLKGVLNGIASVLPIFRKQKSGHIINLSSAAGRRVYPNVVVYCATKFAVRAISEGLRLELESGDNIKVTVIEPGAVRTELVNSIQDPQVREQHSKWLSTITPLEPEDVAESIAYAVTQADRVNVDEILIMPRGQGR
jgi:NADP-dependent 3-hydroxy acid dehydrogenase YdfG